MGNIKMKDVPFENGKGQPLKLCDDCKGQGTKYYTTVKDKEGKQMEVLANGTRHKITRSEPCKRCRGAGCYVIGGSKNA